MWSLDDTSTPQAAHATSGSFHGATPPGMPWTSPQAAPQQAPYASPPRFGVPPVFGAPAPPAYDLPPTYATAAPPTPPTPTAPAASSTYWPPPRASEREDLPAPPPEAFAPEPFIIPPPPAAPAPAAAAPAATPTMPPPAAPSAFEFPPSFGSPVIPPAAPVVAEMDIDDLDVTMFVPRRGKTTYWTIDLPDGSTEIINGSVIVGRLATPVAGRTGARLLTINDPTRSVSKNHAIFTDEEGFLFVEDLDSMNGIVVIRSDGHVTDLVPGKRLRLDHGSTVELGDFLLTAHRN